MQREMAASRCANVEFRSRLNLEGEYRTKRAAHDGTALCSLSLCPWSARLGNPSWRLAADRDRDGWRTLDPDHARCRLREQIGPLTGIRASGGPYLINEIQPLVIFVGAPQPLASVPPNGGTDPAGPGVQGNDADRDHIVLYLNGPAETLRIDDFNIASTAAVTPAIIEIIPQGQQRCPAVRPTDPCWSLHFDRSCAQWLVHETTFTARRHQRQRHQHSK